ncbi:MAG: hypothetical protein ACTHJ3_07780 [Pararhizobium sp.]
MNLASLKPIAKAIAAGVAGAAGGGGSLAVAIPPGVSAPWYAYLIASGMTAVLTAVVTYYVPNRPATPPPVAK